MHRPGADGSAAGRRGAGAGGGPGQPLTDGGCRGAAGAGTYPGDPAYAPLHAPGIPWLFLRGGPDHRRFGGNRGGDLGVDRRRDGDAAAPVYHRAGCLGGPQPGAAVQCLAIDGRGSCPRFRGGQPTQGGVGENPGRAGAGLGTAHSDPGRAAGGRGYSAGGGGGLVCHAPGHRPARAGAEPHDGLWSESGAAAPAYGGGHHRAAGVKTRSKIITPGKQLVLSCVL